jgi:spermidine synthase
MDIPNWKKYLSYIYEFPIESTFSDHNPLLKVTLKNGRYRLLTQHAIYSYEDNYHNFRLSFKKLDWDRFSGQKVLVLGLGLASIIQILEQVFNKRFQYTAIELDETVVYLADKYVLHRLSSPVQVIHADASIFLEVSDEKYDLLCMDIFDDDIIPAKFQDFEFLENLKSSLNPDGVLLYNCLAFTPEDRRLSKTFFESRFLKIFPKGKLLNVKGNYVLINIAEYLIKK